MTDKAELMKTVAKWEQLIGIGCKIKAQSNAIADVSKYLDKMSPRQVDILIVLECLKINTISEMAAFLKISKSTLSIIMNKLVSKGYVFREYPEGNNDGRRVYFKVAPKGHDTFEKLGDIYMEGLYGFYNKFSDENKRLFSKGIACLRQATNAEKTLFAIMMNNNRNSSKYSDEIMQLAKDIMFFLINCKFQKIDDEKVELPDKITQNQLHLLLCIMVGMDTLTKLERHLGSSGSTLSIGVSKMVEKGYVYKEYPDINEDGRKVFFRLTAKGEAVLEKAKAIANNGLITYLSELGDENLKLFDSGCDYILKSLVGV